jgi:hypothetical protein
VSSEINSRSLANWTMHINRLLGIGDPGAVHNKWEPTEDAREVVRRALVIRDSGNAAILTNDQHVLHVRYAEGLHAQLDALEREGEQLGTP